MIFLSVYGIWKLCAWILLQLGFDSLYFARIDYQDRAKRLKEKNLEVVWRGSKSLGSSSQVGSIMPVFVLHFLLLKC